MTEATTTISTILTDVGSFVTQAQTWILSFCGTIVENKLLLLFVVMSVVGFAVGLIRRIINLG